MQAGPAVRACHVSHRTIAEWVEVSLHLIDYSLTVFQCPLLRHDFCFCLRDEALAGLSVIRSFFRVTSGENKTRADGLRRNGSVTSGGGTLLLVLHA